jgi:imidazolonepropionase-like amidohydrolase
LRLAARILRPRRPVIRIERGVAGPLVFRAPLWVGDGTCYDDGRIVVEGGVVTAIGSAAQVDRPFGAEEIDAGWVGPGLIDAHVHLAFGDSDHVLAGGVVAVRDLGAPPADAARWRTLDAPRVAVAGPLLTAPGGYPSRSWGSAGFAAFLDDADQATRLVTGLAAQVDVVKVALEPRAGPVPAADVVAAVVVAAHDCGRRVTAHALTAAMVETALDAGVDELAHTPTELLPDELVARMAAAGTTVVSTLQTFVAGGDGRAALDNARALVAAGVAVRYGTDLGNAGTRPGADPRELALLAGEVGLGAEAALRAATEPVRIGAPAGLVALTGDPREDPGLWRRPVAVLVGTTLLRRPDPS